VTDEGQHDGLSVAVAVQIEIVFEDKCAGVFEIASVLCIYVSDEWISRVGNMRKLVRTLSVRSSTCCTHRRVSLFLRHTITYPSPHCHPSSFLPSSPSFPLPATSRPGNTWDPRPEAPSTAVTSKLPHERQA